MSVIFILFLCLGARRGQFYTELVFTRLGEVHPKPDLALLLITNHIDSFLQKTVPNRLINRPLGLVNRHDFKQHSPELFLVELSFPLFQAELLFIFDREGVSLDTRANAAFIYQL